MKFEAYFYCQEETYVTDITPTEPEAELGWPLEIEDVGFTGDTSRNPNPGSDVIFSAVSIPKDKQR